MQKIKNVTEADVAGKRILLRADLDVANDDTAGDINDARIRANLPTISYLQGQNAKVVIISHAGRPKGAVEKKLSLAPVAARLSALLGTPVICASDCVGPSARKTVSALREGEVAVLENLRFESGEEKNDAEFARRLAEFGDIYVNEAFANSHRTHASMVALPALLPHFAGLHLQEEISRLSGALRPEHPALAIIGGAKFETKQPLIEKFLTLYDRVCVGGAIANDFLKARGVDVKKSRVSDLPVPRGISDNPHISLPEDFVWDAEVMADIGEKTARKWSEDIARAAFVVWSGPMGIYEQGFTKGMDILAEAIIKSSCRAVIGGGDTDAALGKHSFDSERVFLSMGGGAMLQFLADGTLPGVEALR